MWSKVTLTNFKSFRQAEVPIGPFTVIVGTNASGKSNIRDAFRFLHGIGREYSLAEVVGTKYGDGGEPVWWGIRGGLKELAFSGYNEFAVEVSDDSPGIVPSTHEAAINYSVSINLGNNGISKPIIQEERLSVGNRHILEINPYGLQAPSGDNHIRVKLLNRNVNIVSVVQSLSNSSPAFIQVLSSTKLCVQLSSEDYAGFRSLHSLLASVRFLDLAPDKMRQPSFPGQMILGDRGENLSSVLQTICEDPNRKAALLEWVRELTPLDATDFEFPPDHIGRVLLTLVEADGRRTSAYSASDGTLRFLAMAAALLGPVPAEAVLIEELDNGIHPTRLHLLLQLIEKAVKGGKTQVIATTHSPQLLGLLSGESLEAALLVYRLPHHPESRVKRILDLPNARELIAKQSAGRLHATGWLEDAVAFTEGGDG